MSFLHYLCLNNASPRKQSFDESHSQNQEITLKFKICLWGNIIQTILRTGCIENRSISVIEQKWLFLISTEKKLSYLTVVSAFFLKRDIFPKINNLFFVLTIVPSWLIWIFSNWCHWCNHTSSCFWSEITVGKCLSISLLFQSKKWVDKIQQNMEKYLDVTVLWNDL